MSVSATDQSRLQLSGCRGADPEVTHGFTTPA